MMEYNNIYLGDCYELIKELPDKSIDLVYTDIPYLLEDGGLGHSPLGHRMKKKREELRNIMNGIDWSILDDLCRVSKNIYMYIWLSQRQIKDVLNYFSDKNCRCNLLVWCKTNPAPMTNDMWLPDLEYCICIKGKGTPRYNDGYDLKHKYYISKANKEDKDDYGHPTIKPLELVKKHILHSTSENDIVLDPFCGSGTTCKACQELNRRYIGFEIDPKYYAAAIDRMNNININGEVSLF